MIEWSLKLREELMPEDADERKEVEQWLEESTAMIKADPEYKAFKPVMEAMDSPQFYQQLGAYGSVAVTADGQVLPADWKVSHDDIF